VLDQHITGGAEGADEAGVLGVVSEFLAQGGNVDVDAPVEDFVVPLPDFLEELVAGADLAAGAGEAEEEVELDGGEGEGAVVEGGAARGGDDAEGAEYDIASDGGEGGGGGLALGAAGDGAEAGEEFAGGEGLRQVVVGADFEADDPVGLVAPGGEHENRDVGPGADAAEDFEAIDAGEHDVEDDGVPGAGAGAGEGLLDAVEAGVGGCDGIAEGGEVVGEEAAEFPVVVDQEEAAGGGAVASQGFAGGGMHRRGGLLAELDPNRSAGKCLRNLPNLNNNPASSTSALYVGGIGSDL